MKEYDVLDTVRETLLELDYEEKVERAKVRVDYNFYKGATEDKLKAEYDKTLLGQSWKNIDNIDYEPTQDIRNKVKPLLKKQARWLFGKEPTIVFNAFDKKDKLECEELRKFIDKILSENRFWSNTKKAFLMSTIKKRVLLRAAANPKRRQIKFRYDEIENFSYKEIDDTLLEVKLLEQDLKNYDKEDNEKIYYLHIYNYIKNDSDKFEKASYTLKTYKGSDLLNPIKENTQEIGFSYNLIPVWLIKNGGELNSRFGESDLHDLKEPQNQYNRIISDFCDGLKFQMFGSTTIVDGDEEDVNKLTIAPNSLQAIKTDKTALTQGKQATLTRQEYSISSSNAIDTYLKRCEEDMEFIMDMPSLRDLTSIPSGKAMRYLYNDLVARCEEKWADWTPIFIDVIRYTIAIADECKLEGFNPKWKDLRFSISFKHNYPIPQDEQETKSLAMSEVSNNVKSRVDYIREFGVEEDAEETFQNILKEMLVLNQVELGEYQLSNKKENTQIEIEEETEEELNDE